MNQMQVFNSPVFGQVRTMEEDGKVLFCANDIARALGYTNPQKATRDHCRGVTKRSGVSFTTNQHGKESTQVTEMNFIPEGDMYRLIVRSKLPSAEKFERWVMDEVLPTIRKTGSYGQAPQIDMAMITEIITKTATAVVSEMVKQLLPILHPVASPVCNPHAPSAVPNITAEYYEIPPTRFKMETFPPTLLKAVHQMMEDMRENQAINFSAISRFCTAHGHPISYPAVKRYYVGHFAH